MKKGSYVFIQFNKCTRFDVAILGFNQEKQAKRIKPEMAGKKYMKRVRSQFLEPDPKPTKMVPKDAKVLRLAVEPTVETANPPLFVSLLRHS